MARLPARSARRVQVEFPEESSCQWLKAVQPAVSAGKNNLWSAIDSRENRRRPLAVNDVRAGSAAAPRDCAGRLVHGQERWRVRLRDRIKSRTNAVARHAIHEVTYYER